MPRRNQENIVKTLHEEVNKEMLERIIASEDLNEQIRTQLKTYYFKMKKNTLTVNYKHADKIGRGRLNAIGNISLQNIKKEIRHAIAKEYYHDIDMVNAHPNLILQYCEKNEIKCKYLKAYVKKREKILTEIMNKHDVDRSKAKNLMLKLCYLGNYTIEVDGENYEPDEKIKFLEDFLCEMREIAKNVCKKNRDIYDIVKNDKEKENKRSSVLSLVAQEIENECLMKMYDFFTNKGFTVGVLCFDGLMIRRNENNDKNIKEELLRKCENYVMKKTGYTIRLEEKEMDTKLSIKLPKWGNYVKSDLDCQEKLFLIEGENKFKYCKKELYIFDEKTGMFDSNIETLYYYLKKNKDYLIRTPHNDNEINMSYGEYSKLMTQVVPLIKMAAKDDFFIERTQDSSLGYLLFKNGIYDMKKGEFQYGFNPDIVFHGRIPWDYPERDEKKIKEAYDLSFGKIFKDPKPMIYALACALAGETKLKNFYFCPGRQNAGKSKLVNMLEKAFGDYVGNFNAENIAFKSSNDTTDEAAKNRWALIHRFKRILYSSEVNMKKSLNGNDIKKHASGGDSITARNHHKGEVDFKPNYTIFCLLNDIPKIEPMDGGVNTRLKYIDFPYVFVKEKSVKEKDYHKLRDKNLDEKISKKSFVEGFIHIFLDAYKDYLKNGMPKFDKEIKNKWTQDNKQETEITDVIREHYDITGNQIDTVTVSEIKKFRQRNKEIFSTISNCRFNEIMTSLGLEQKRNKTDRFWCGIAKKEENFF